MSGADDTLDEQPKSDGDQEIEQQWRQCSDGDVGRLYIDVAARQTGLRQRGTDLQQRAERVAYRIRTGSAEGPGHDFLPKDRLDNQQQEPCVVRSESHAMDFAGGHSDAIQQYLWNRELWQRLCAGDLGCRKTFHYSHFYSLE